MNSWLETQVKMVELITQIEIKTDKTLGVLLNQGWFHNDDVALNAALDRGIEMGQPEETMRGIVKMMQAHPHRPGVGPVSQ